MTDAPLADAPPGASPTAPGPAAASPLALTLSGLMAAAAAIHFAMVPSHAGAGSLIDPLGFAVVAWIQLCFAAAFLTGHASRRVLIGSILTNVAVLYLWMMSRTTGLPVGAHKGVEEPFGLVDGVSAGIEVAAVLLAAYLLVPARAGATRATASHASRVGPAMAAVAVLGLATVVMTSDEAASHGGAGHDHGASADHHADDATVRAEMARIDGARCDRAFNPVAYWDEANALGVDTYQGGAMATAHDHAAATSGAAATASATPTTVDDPTHGRGSAQLDKLVSATSLSDGSELAAARLVTSLSESSDADYASWLSWMRRSGTSGHAHASTSSAAAPDETGGHGGHAGPQQWTALTAKADCTRLASELALARRTAMKYPTPAEAAKGGYRMVTPYVPGIAAHWMNYDLVDDTFEIDRPEMLLYDGNGEDAQIAGVSYYIIHEGDAEPTQGFTGANDHFHRHIGLCLKDGVTIGDTTTTVEECAARGGEKSTNSKGWMSHAWVVPGCESPWGVFSAASPLLDGDLAEGSGDGEGACVHSGVKDRYDLRPGTAVPWSATSTTASSDQQQASGD